MDEKQLTEEVIRRIDKKIETEVIKLLESYGVKESAGYKNIIAIQTYTKDSREMVRNLQGEHKRLLDQVKQQKLALDGLRAQIVALQMQVYQNKATG